MLAFRLIEDYAVARQAKHLNSTTCSDNASTKRFDSHVSPCGRSWAKILVIDDDRGIRHLLDIFLCPKSYEVLLAENGQDGLELFRQANPGVIVPDLKMPDMTG